MGLTWWPVAVAGFACLAMAVAAALLLPMEQVRRQLRPMANTSRLTRIPEYARVARARLVSIGDQFEEAARDLGATRVQALRLVLLPQLGPAIFARLIVVFATSVDDFVISQFLSTGASSETVPIKIYASARAAATPAVNALATVMLVITLLAVAATGSAVRALKGRAGAGAADLTSMSI